MDLELLRRLTEGFGPSGYEDEIRSVLHEAVKDAADEVRVDPLGSLVAYKQGQADGRKIMLAAHMDEIGLMVTHIEEKGFLRFTSIGGLRSLNLVGSRVRFADGLLGSIAVEYRENASAIPALQHLYIDIGASSREDAPLRVGTPGVLVGPLYQQANQVVSKTMDNRIGCYILVELLRQLTQPKDHIYVVFSTQEEITLSGARTSAFRIDPDLAIAVDVTSTGDTPKALPMEVSLGAGPAVKIKDAGMVAHPLVRDLLIEAAEKAGLPYQLEILLGGSTDAAAMQLVRSGVPSGCLSVPCRYVHSVNETVDRDDVENAIQILLTALNP